MTAVDAKSTKEQAPSASLLRPTYWWYVARGRFLPLVLSPFVESAEHVLDIGSADGPSAAWLPGCIPLDIDPSGLAPGGVCASATSLPFADETFDVVSAFDVIEHFENEQEILAELRRVLKPGGALLASLPAYQWAWSSFDERAGHYRRYTRRRAVSAFARAGLQVDRSTYAFALTFPFFALVRLLVKLGYGTGQPSEMSPMVERVLLALCRAEEALLRRWSLPFGSSVIVAARK